MKFAWYFASLLCGCVAIIWVMCVWAFPFLSNPLLAAVMAVATTLVLHCGAYCLAREERSKNPDVISRTHYWTSPTGYTDLATEKDVYEYQHGRGSWNPARDAMLVNVLGPICANVTGLAVLFIWSILWPPLPLHIGSVCIQNVRVLKSSPDWATDLIREFDAKLPQLLGATTNLRVLDPPPVSLIKDGDTPWQAYRDSGIDSLLIPEISFDSRHRITGRVHLIGTDKGQSLWSKEFLLENRGIDQMNGSELNSRMDEFARQLVQSLHFRLGGK